MICAAGFHVLRSQTSQSVSSTGNASDRVQVVLGEVARRGLLVKLVGAVHVEDEAAVRREMAGGVGQGLDHRVAPRVGTTGR